MIKDLETWRCPDCACAPVEAPIWSATWMTVKTEGEAKPGKAGTPGAGEGRQHLPRASGRSAAHAHPLFQLSHP